MGRDIDGVTYIALVNALPDLRKLKMRSIARLGCHLWVAAGSSLTAARGVVPNKNPLQFAPLLVHVHSSIAKLSLVNHKEHEYA